MVISSRSTWLDQHVATTKLATTDYARPRRRSPASSSPHRWAAPLTIKMLGRHPLALGIHSITWSTLFIVAPKATIQHCMRRAFWATAVKVNYHKGVCTQFLRLLIKTSSWSSIEAARHNCDEVYFDSDRWHCSWTTCQRTTIRKSNA